MTDKIYKLVYASAASEQMSDYDLFELLDQARMNNSKLGLTGLLLHYDGNFFQLLEGQKEVVESMFEKIRQDSRHTQIIRLYHEKGVDREFPDWTMGFEELEGESGADLIIGLNQLISKGSLNLEDEAILALSEKTRLLLGTFKKISGMDR